MLGLLILALGLRLYRLTAESLWFDEAYAVWSSGMEIASLRVLWEWKIEFALYYLLLHGWMRLLGQGEFAVRAFSALAGTLAIAPIYLLGRALWNRRIGALGALLLAVNPYHVWFSQEVRSYAWVVLLALISLYAFWRLVQDGHWGWWVAHVLSTGLAFHLHYYTVWIVLAQNVYYLGRLWLLHGAPPSWRPTPARPAVRGGNGWWRALRGWLLDQAGVLLLALPALAVFLTFYFGRNQWGWLADRYRPPTPRALLDLFSAYSLGTLFPGPAWLRRVVLLAFLAAAAWGVLTGMRRAGRERSATTLVLLALGLPVALIYLLGQFSTLWVARYLLIFLPAYLLLVALGVGALAPARLGLAASALLVAANLYALGGMYRVQQKEDWRGVAGYLATQAAASDLIVLLDEECRVPFGYYYGAGGARVEVSRFADEAALDRAVDDIRRRQRGGQLWLVVSHADSAGLERRLSALPGLTPVKAPPFVGIKLVAYAWK